MPQMQECSGLAKWMSYSPVSKASYKSLTILQPILPLSKFFPISSVRCMKSQILLTETEL